ncbi:hypothetical protein BHM03_00037910 [Ensete ventricosum]|nr:hypothetical protein BHM03_00037910 [Ensete ventricosum]
MEEESQLTDYAVHALAGYSNPQMTKVGGLLKQQPITVLIDTGSTNNFLQDQEVVRLLHVWHFKSKIGFKLRVMGLYRIELFYAFLLRFCSEDSEESGGWPRPGPLQGRPAMAKAPYRGGRPRPRSPTKRLPATAWAARKSGRPPPARSQAMASLR